MTPSLTLDDESRKKLDGIVQQMSTNKESDENIQFVVDDFKKKYGKPSTESTPGTISPEHPDFDKKLDEALSTMPKENSYSVEKIPKEYDRLRPETYKNLKAGTNYVTADRNGNAVVKTWNADKQQFERVDDPDIIAVASQKMAKEKAPIDIKEVDKEAIQSNAINPDSGKVLNPKDIIRRAGIDTYLNNDKIKEQVATQYAILKTMSQQKDVKEYMQLKSLYAATEDETARKDISKKMAELREKPFTFQETGKPVDRASGFILNPDESLIPSIPKFKNVEEAVKYTLDEEDAGGDLYAEYGRNAEQLNRIREEYEKLEPQNPKGFWYNAAKAIQDHSAAIERANRIAMGSDEDAMKELENNYIQSRVFPVKEPEGMGKFGQIVGNVTASAAPTITASTAITATTGNPVAGLLAGGIYAAQDMARVQYAEGMQEQYNELRDKGTMQSVAYGDAKKYAKTSSMVAGGTGLLVGTFLPGLQGESQAIERTSMQLAKQFFKDVAKNAAVDFTVGSTSQTLDNYLAEQYGSDKSLFDGVVNQGALMSVQGLVVGLLTHGIPTMAKYVDAKSRERAIEALANLKPEQLEKLYSNAEQAGSDKQEIANLKTEVEKEATIIKSVPKDLTDKQKEKVKPLLRMKQAVMDQQAADESSLFPKAHYDNQIAEIDKKILAAIGEKEEVAKPAPKKEEEKPAPKEEKKVEPKKEEAKKPEPAKPESADINKYVSEHFGKELGEINKKLSEKDITTDEGRAQVEKLKERAAKEISEQKEAAKKALKPDIAKFDEYEELAGKKGIKGNNNMVDWLHKNGEKGVKIKFVTDNLEELKAKLEELKLLKIDCP